MMQLQEKSSLETARGRKERVIAWRRWLKDLWARGRRARSGVFKEMTGSHAGPVAALVRREDGTLTADAMGIDAILQQA